MALDPKEQTKIPRRYGFEVGSRINNWGDNLNTDLADIDGRLAELEAAALVQPDPADAHPVLGLIAGCASGAALAVSSAAPISRSRFFDVFRRKA